MVYVYVLQCEKDGHFYTGCSRDLKARMALHQSGRVASTAKRLPVALVYYEACIDERDAFKREKYLKTTYGKRYIRTRCRNYFTGQANPVE
jgi:putative endonuclease